MQTTSTTITNPLKSADLMAALIADVTNRPVDEVTARLWREYRRPGITVAEDFARRGIPRYTPGEAMDRFYADTDAFLYETAVWNRNRLKRDMRKWIAHHLNEFAASSQSPKRRAAAARGSTRLNILTIGDGMGFDAAECARHEHNVTYFEVPGPHVEFARQLFDLAGHNITMLTDAAAIERGRYDAVICLDVLEHVADPPAFVRMISTYIRPGGRLYVHAPFYMIHPRYPTHLKANRCWSGRMSLYMNAGLHLIDGKMFWNPLVFARPASSDTSLVKSPLTLSLAGLYLALGRISAIPLYPVHWLRRGMGRWFNR